MHVLTLLSFDNELKKIAADLTTHARNDIKTKNFAIPGQRKYPIENAAHARDALSRVSADGTPAQKSEVRHAVARKWPGVVGAETKHDLRKAASVSDSIYGVLAS